MGSLWDDIRKSLKEGLETVADYTEEYTKVGRLKVDVAAIKHSINRLFGELGGRVYELITHGGGSNIASDDKVNALVGRIKALEEKLRTKEADIEKVKKEKAEERRKKSASAETPPVEAKGDEAPPRTAKKRASRPAPPPEEEFEGA